VQAQNNNFPWFALRVRSHYEAAVKTHLEYRGFETFLPTYSSRRRWSDRVKDIEVPLFTGYLFCRLNPLNRLPVVSAPGVVHIVGIGRRPVPVAECEIAAIQAAIKSGLPRQPWPFMRLGERVRIERGPLSGVEGILLGFKGQQRLVLSVTLLQRSVAVQIEQDWARPLGSLATAAPQLVTA
jgi:transcription antitermination factor NusG